MDPKGLEAAIGRSILPTSCITDDPSASPLTQATEIGTIYSLDEIGTIAGGLSAPQAGRSTWMARAFANALVSLDCTPAEMTWKSGVDMVSFGGTKTWLLVRRGIGDLRSASRRKTSLSSAKRAAQLFSKSRFVAAQFEAYFDNGLWLGMAGHANAMAAKLADHVDASPDAPSRLAPAGQLRFSPL